MKRTRDNDDNFIGCTNDNPILDTRRYVVEFEDDEQAELAANTISQSMYAQCYPEGNQYVMFDLIVDSQLRFVMLTRKSLRLMEGLQTLFAGPMLYSNCVFNGRMVPPHGRNFLT